MKHDYNFGPSPKVKSDSEFGMYDHNLTRKDSSSFFRGFVAAIFMTYDVRDENFGTPTQNLGSASDWNPALVTPALLY